MPEPITIVCVERTEAITDAIKRAPAAEKAAVHRYDTLDTATNGWVLIDPDIVLVDLCIGDTPSSVFDWIERYKLRNPGVAVFVCAQDQAPEFLLAAMRAGAQEFLPLPVPQAQLNEAITRISNMRRHRQSAAAATGKILSVYSSKGGLGVTTLAINLAAGLSLYTENDQALMGLDFQLGDVTSFLDLKPEYTVRDVLRGADQVDQEALRSSMSYHDSGIFVLAEPRDVTDASVSAAQVRSILSGFRQTYPYSVIDLPHALNPQTVAAFEASDEIFLVTVANISAVHAAKRTLSVLEGYGYGSDKVRLVLNRASRRDEISVKDVEKALDWDVYWTIPNDYRAVIEAINTGLPLVHSGRMSKVGKSIYGLAELTAGPEPEE